MIRYSYIYLSKLIDYFFTRPIHLFRVFVYTYFRH